MQRQFIDFGLSQRDRKVAVAGLAENSKFNAHLARRLSQNLQNHQRKQPKNKQGG